MPVGRDHTPPSQRDIYQQTTINAPISPIAYPGYPPFSPMHPYVYDPYMTMPMAHRPGKRIVGEDFRGMYGPPQGWSRSVSPRLPAYAHAPTPPPSSVMANPEIRETYERIKERQYKLSLLKKVNNHVEMTYILSIL